MGSLDMVVNECCTAKLNQVNELEVGGQLKFSLER